MAHHPQEGHRLSGQRHGRLSRFIANLLFRGYAGLAFVLHSLVFSLRFTPLGALFGPASRAHLPERTYECSVCGAIYSFNGYTFVLALGATRPRPSERPCPAIALPNDFWKHSTWIVSKEENHD